MFNPIPYQSNGRTSVGKAGNLFFGDVLAAEGHLRVATKRAHEALGLQTSPVPFGPDLEGVGKPEKLEEKIVCWKSSLLFFWSPHSHSHSHSPDRAQARPLKGSGVLLQWYTALYNTLKPTPTQRQLKAQ